MAASLEAVLGRKLWCISGQPGLWSGDVNSEHNSQYFADPYTFSHISHGLLLYGLAWILARGMPIRVRALIALAIEAAWEVVENTDFVIQRYRATTISLHHYGDSVANSMFDIVACMAGFGIAEVLPARASVVLLIVLEAVLIVTIRDSLLLNIVMLIHPVAAIKIWQSAVE